MATSCKDVVDSALRKCGVLAGGREPRTADREDTFNALKALYRQWINNGAFGRLRDVIPLTDYTARPNERIFRNQSATLQVTLPDTVRNWPFWRDYWIRGIYPNEPVQYPLTAMSDATTPRDCSVVVINDAFTGETYDFIYDGHQKLWTGLYALALTDEAPLSFRDPQGLAAALAIQIVDEFGGEIGAVTAMQARNFTHDLTHRYSMPATVVAGEYF